MTQMDSTKMGLTEKDLKIMDITEKKELACEKKLNMQ